MTFDLTDYQTLNKYISLSHSVSPIKIAYIVEDSEKSHAILDEIFAESYKRWGGRGTLIIPCQKGAVNSIYIHWLEKYDPDILYSYVDLNDECLKRISRVTMPVRLLRHNESDRSGNKATLTPKHGADAVKALSMVPYLLRQQDKNKPVIIGKGFDCNQDRFILDNFGTENCNSNSDLYTALSVVSENANQKNVHYGQKVNNVTEMLVKMTEDQSILTASQLSFFDSPCLSHEQSLEQGINVIIGDSCQDRITFWNMALFMERPSFIMFPALIVSKSKFSDIKFIQSFVNFLKSRHHQFAGNYHFANIKVSSSSLSGEEIDECINNAKENVNTISIMAVKCIELSNFNLNDIDVYNSRQRSERFNEIPFEFTPLEPEHFQYIPFHMQKLKNGKYAVNLKIERYNNNSNVINRPHSWVLPRRFDILHLFIGKVSRVNKYGSISFFYTCMANSFSSDKIEVSVKFPEDSVFFGNIFCAEKLMAEDDLRAAKPVRPFSDFKTSEKGRALQAVIHLFGELYHAFDFINNLFWREYVQTAVSYEPAINNNHQPIYKLGEKIVDIDLEGLKRIKSKILNQFIKEENRNDFNGKEARGQVIDDMQRYLKLLVASSIVYQGYKWNCRKCANINWVSVNNKIQLLNKCTVCDNEDQIDVIPLSWLYRLNQRVADALYKEAVICELWTLGFLLNCSKRSMYYIQQTDLFRYIEDKQSDCEVDIICVVDGKFIIGESKYFSCSFDDKSIDKLISLANELNPDEIILSFIEMHGNSVDKYKDKIESHGFTVTILNPEATEFHRSNPWSYF